MLPKSSFPPLSASRSAKTRRTSWQSTAQGRICNFWLQERSAEVSLEPLPPVIGDPVQFLQLFQNLVGNAIKYSREGVPPRIRISAEKSAPAEYCFAVRDNGLGIEAKNFDLTFTLLKRLHGHWLVGLQKIVERHSG